MNPIAAVLSSLLVASAALDLAAAQPLPLGNTAIVNTVLDLSADGPRLGVDGAGSFRIVWQQAYVDDHYEIRSRRIQANGSLGSESTLNAYTDGNQLVPDVAMNESADWGAIWQSTDQEGAGTGTHIYARRTTANGSLLSGELAIDNPATTATVSAAAVDVDGTDEMAVAWIDASHTLWFERSTPAGVEHDEFTVGVTDSSFAHVAVAALGFNRSVIAWTDADGDSQGVFLRCVSNVGPLGAAVPVNTSFTSLQFKPSIAAADDGHFAVVWYSSTSASRLHVRLFDRDCNPTSGEIDVDDSPSFPSTNARVGMAADGAFVVGWDIHGEANDILAREFTKSGVPVGSAFSVQGGAFGSPGLPDVAVGPTTFAVAWHAPDYGLDDTLDVLVRRFTRRVVFTDDFESEGTAAWSSVTP